MAPCCFCLIQLNLWLLRSIVYLASGNTMTLYLSVCLSVCLRFSLTVRDPYFPFLFLSLPSHSLHVSSSRRLLTARLPLSVSDFSISFSVLIFSSVRLWLSPRMETNIKCMLSMLHWLVLGVRGGV